MNFLSRRRSFLALAALLLTSLVPAHADEEFDTIRQRGRLSFAVYNDFPPYSNNEKGLDVDLAKALAAKLGLKAEIIGFKAGEEMADDLRNMVWKGHYLRGDPANVMMRVPVDPILAKGNEKVRIFAPYHYEVMGMARVASRVPVPAGSAAIALEVFTREKIGVEGESLADSFLLSVLRGRLKENVVHFRSITEAAQALREDKIAAIMAPRGELEGTLAGDTRYVIDEAKLGELNPKGWPVGMAVKAESADLATALSGALAELQQDGTVAAIFKKYGVTLQTH
ncbi:MAG: transporter substrate-binding domain-containing protein [Rhodocyclaceae bacterium]|jgi:ABC-type amino acid transport substrate-binding protein|nr:MAG: transporter substrate-binding domain-containing protein [Rhodocyclaceae bacterium]